MLSETPSSSLFDGEEKGIRLSGFARGVSRVPFTLVNGLHRVSMKIGAGLLGVVQDDEGFLVPKLGWVIVRV